MKISSKRMLLVTAAFIGVTVAAVWLAIHSSDTQRVVETSSFAPDRAGQRAVIDPVTGELTERRLTTPAAERAAEQAAFNTSGEGLEPVPNPVPGGGVKIDLQGRFRSPVTATIDEDGEVSISHGVDPAATAEEE